MSSPNHDRVQLSVVIPARNEAGTISAAIAPLLDEAPVTLEIIVADGRSTDATRDVVGAIAAIDDRVRLIDNPARVTPCGLNEAIRAARGDIIVRMDGHAVPGPGYLASCLSVLGSTDAWSVGGVLDKQGLTPAGRAAAAAATSPFGVGGGVRQHFASVATDVATVWPGCWPRWVFERVGLFDPEMIQDQDEELSQRILDAGGRIRFDPSIQASYVSRASWRGLFRQHFRYGFYKVRAIQKRPRLLRLRHLVPAAFVGFVVASIVLAVADPRALLLATGALVAWVLAALWFARQAASHPPSTGELVAAFACMHVGYGAGMWAGAVRFLPRWVIDRRGGTPVLEPRPG